MFRGEYCYYVQDTEHRSQQSMPFLPPRRLYEYVNEANKYFELKKSWSCCPNLNYLLSSIAGNHWMLPIYTLQLHTYIAICVCAFACTHARTHTHTHHRHIHRGTHTMNTWQLFSAHVHTHTHLTCTHARTPHTHTHHTQTHSPR